MTTAPTADLVLTERYLGQMERLRRLGGAEMEKEWDRLGAHDESDIKLFRTKAEPILGALGTTSSAFTNGYVAALSGTRPEPLTFDIDQDLRHPFIGMWKALKEGKPFDDALAAGRSRSASLASERVMLSQSETAKRLAGPVGWRRVPRGSTCSYCILTSTQRYKTAESAARVGHRNKGRRTCDCSIVPIIGDRDPGRVINQPTLTAWKKAQGKDGGPAYFDADGMAPIARPDRASRARTGQGRVNAEQGRLNGPTQGNLDLESLGPLPKPSALPNDIDGVTAGELADAKRDLPKLRAKVRENAEAVRDEARFALDSADSFRMAPPYAQGSTEARSTGLYDWFYNLSPAEQRRLKDNGWMSGHRQGSNPDQIAERIGEFYGAADYDASIAAWLDETRRYDAGALLQRGKVPLPGRYGDLDVDAVFGDGTFRVNDLYDTDPDRVLRSIASTYKGQAEEFAARTFVKPSGGASAPYQMTQAQYVDELTQLEAKAANIKPIRSDPEFGDEFAPADDAVLRRLDEMVPQGIVGAESLPADILHQKIMELAREGGLV